MKKRSSKLESTRKTEQDRPLSEILTFGQRSTQKSKSIGPGSKSTDTGPGRFRVSGSGHGLNSGAVTSSYDVSMTWTRADVDMLAWLLMWTDDVIR